MTARTATTDRADSRVPNTGLLRFAFSADALATGGDGVAYLALGGVRDSVLGMPASFLRPIGAFLIVYAVLVGVLATRVSVPRIGVLAVIVANAVWAIDSIVLAAADWYTPTTGGTVW